MRRRGLVVVGLVVAICFFAVTQGEAKSRPQPTLTQHLDMVYVTLVKVQTEKSLDQFTVAGSGNVYLTVWLRAQNRNDVQLGVDSSSFTIAAADGTIVNAGFQSPSPVLGGLLDPGGKTYGSITFEVPAAAHQETLRWAVQPSWMNAHWPERSWALHY